MPYKQPFTPVDVLQSALTYLLSRHSMIVSQQEKGCLACSALTITQHLQLLLNHPNLPAGALKVTYRGLLRDWKAQAEHIEQQSAMRFKSENAQTLQLH